ncbi:MAG: 3,5-nucleoside bisphosphate phosphatase [Clostridiales bacterium]|nr:3,5-nucleoside bisphosphate phosphatase [Clostridiales bacterium]MDN5282242.1 3,5-nucleoside bisphosphate phosphatase [Candidatus Ozemobacter sp.]
MHDLFPTKYSYQSQNYVVRSYDQYSQNLVAAKGNVLKKNPIFADLHVHSTASDGLLTPGQIVDSAAQKGLAAVAITDHDTIGGVAEAKSQGKEKGLEVIAGIELSCGWEGRDASIHVLGLFIDENSGPLLELLDSQKRFRHQRALKIVGLLEKCGLDMSELKNEFEASTEKVLGRPHIARFLLEKGYIKEFQQAFDKYLSGGRPAYVPKDHVDPIAGIETIKKAGGIAVLAHPGLIPDWEVVWEKISDMPWDGMETYYSEHSNSQVRKFAEIVAEKGWASTGGSDYHGDYGKHKNRLGKYGLDAGQYGVLIDWCKTRGIDGVKSR